MNWAIAGLLYCVAYAAIVEALPAGAPVRLLAGNVGLLLPPIAPLIVLFRRRHDWRGRQAVFWGAIGAWAALWLVGQIGWASDEILRATPLPWFTWHIILQLSGSALPLIALVAWPHRAVAAETAITVALDITVLFFLTGYLYWSLIIAPGMDPAHSSLALRILAIVGPFVRLAAVAGLLVAAVAARRTAWATVYQRLALGLGLAFVALAALSVATVRGDYRTGAMTDVGWMLPFFFAAWAAATAPASPPPQSATIAAWTTKHSSPVLLFIALLAVPVLGRSLRYLVPLGAHVDRMRELATTFTLVCGGALVIVRLRLEQRAVEQANQRVRLLATACEQASELILIVRRDNRIEYANDAFCRATGYTHDELDTLAPQTLVAASSLGQLDGLRDNLRARRVTRLIVGLTRKDGSTFETACAAAPIVDASGGITHFVAVIRDIADELRLREQLVRGERLSALGEFVSGVAHELNNPLQSVIGTLDLLLDHQHEPAVRGDLERTRFEAGRAGRTVRNLLTFVKQSPDERLLTDLNEVVKATLAVRAYDLEVAGVETHEDYARMLPLVLANREEIQQVLLHLIINAQQAMSDQRGARVLTIRTYMLSGDAVVDVCDTGPGIPDHLSGRIFEPFFTTKATGVGTGLGLSMSLGIAHAHGGSLALMPSAAGGCFRLTLPGAGFPGPASVH